MIPVSYTHLDITIDTPRDRDGSFEPQLISKRQRDVSGIEDKVLAMYARGMKMCIRDRLESLDPIKK